MIKKEDEIRIDFYKELYKSLCEDEDDDDNNKCLITDEPLDEKYSITLECNHSFNYMPLYTEICNQKYKHKTYKPLLVSIPNSIHRRYTTHYICCPYCRNIQHELLPFFPELNIQQKYGICKTNSFSKIDEENSKLLGEGFYYKGVWFVKDLLCDFVQYYDHEYCPNTMSAYLSDADKCYCSNHYFSEMRAYKSKIKEEKKTARIKAMAEAKMQKEEMREKKKKEKQRS